MASEHRQGAALWFAEPVAEIRLAAAKNGLKRLQGGLLGSLHAAEVAANTPEDRRFSAFPFEGTYACLDRVEEGVDVRV
jgi:hypothetical protein